MLSTKKRESWLSACGLEMGLRRVTLILCLLKLSSPPSLQVVEEGSPHFLYPLLVLAGIELIFFLVADIILCSGFSVRKQLGRKQKGQKLPLNYWESEENIHFYHRNVSYSGGEEKMVVLPSKKSNWFQHRIGTSERWKTCHIDAINSSLQSRLLHGTNCLGVFPPLSLILSQSTVATSPLFTGLQCKCWRNCVASASCLCSLLGYRFQQLPKGSDKKGRKPAKSGCLSPEGEMSMLRIVG